MSGWMRVFDARKSRRSCVAPRPVATQRICRVTGWIKSCTFSVWRFFFPLYQSRCFFWGVRTVPRSRPPRPPSAPYRSPSRSSCPAGKSARSAAAHLPSGRRFAEPSFRASPTPDPGGIRPILPQEFQRQQQLRAHRQGRRASRLAFASLSLVQHRVHLCERLQIDPGSSAKICPVQLQSLFIHQRRHLLQPIALLSQEV